MGLSGKPLNSEAAIATAVDYLLREFNQLQPPKEAFKAAGTGDGFTGPIEPSFLVASSTATEPIRNVADFVCSGSDDDLEIQFALDQLPFAGGRVQLTEGVYSVSGPIVTTNTAWLAGVGTDATRLTVDEGSWSDTVTVLKLTGTSSKISDLSIDGTGASGVWTDTASCIEVGSEATVENVDIQLGLMFSDGGPFQWGLYAAQADIRVSHLTGSSDVYMAGSDGRLYQSAIGMLELGGGDFHGGHCTVQLASLITGGNNWLTDFDFTSGLDVQGGSTHFENCEMNTLTATGSLGSLVGCLVGSTSDITGTGWRIVGCTISGTFEFENDTVFVGNKTALNVTVNGTADSATDGEAIIVGNTMRAALILDGACGVHIGANYIDGAAQTNAILIQNGSDRNVIDGVTIGATCTNGINISTSDCDDTVIGANVIRGATNDVVDSGTGTRQPKLINLAYADSSDPLTTKTGQQPWILTEPGEVIDVRCVVDTAPTDASIIVDVNINGASLWSASGLQPDILTTATDSDLHAPDQNAAYVDGDVVTIDIDQVGSTIAGSNLTVIIRVRPTF